MSFIGDLERAFAASLYPNRVPIAVGLAIALVVLILVARRRGWLAAAARHPRRSALVAVLALAIGLPAGWYLGSPLFIRNSLVEPEPSAATGGPSASPVAVASATPGASPSASTAVATPAAPTLAPPLTGRFRGADDFHFGRGTARLIQTGPDTWTLRFEDFSVRNGPDLYVYLSPDPAGYADDAIELGRLRATDGSFNTPVPPGTDVSGVRSVVIWCKQFSVQFAVAKLS